MTRLLLVLAGTLLVSACGTSGEPDGAAGTDPGGTSPSASSGPGDVDPAATTELAVLTEADDASHVELPVGTELPIRLSSEWAWEQPVLEGAVGEVSPVDHFADPGYQEWLLTTTSAGEATVTAVGAPNCADEAECPERTVTIHVTVTD
jgi:predicted secreted protein